MESSYLTVEFFRRLPQEVEKGGNPATLNPDRYSEGHFRRIGSNVSSYVGMVAETLKNTIPKAVVYCQVREAKQSLLNHFYTQLGKKEVLSLSLATHPGMHCAWVFLSMLKVIELVGWPDGFDKKLLHIDDRREEFAPLPLEAKFYLIKSISSTIW